MSGNTGAIGLDPTGRRQLIALDANGEVIVISIPADNLKDDPGALAISRVVNAAPTRLVQIYGQLDAAAGANHWIHLFDAAALPANGTAPDYAPIELAPGQQFSLSFPAVLNATGLVWASSSTFLTLTAAGAANVWATTVHRP